MVLESARRIALPRRAIYIGAMSELLSPSAAALDALKAAVGADSWSDDAATLAPYLTDWRGRLQGRAALLLRPRDTAAVARLVKAAAAHRVALVPQGGNTGLVGGATPDPGGGAVVVSVARLNALGPVDSAGLTVTVGAGAILEAVHAHVAAAGCSFPLSLAAKGSATIGGLVSTNAGGVQVLRHGNMRALVAGLEAVLPDGSRLDQLGPLAKDNSGYDIKQLLIGAEGTLGIVTAVTLRLVPAAVETVVGWAGLASPQAALALLVRLRQAVGEAVESFELIPASGLALVLADGGGHRSPLASDPVWHVLIELSSVRADAGLATALTAVLAAALDDGVIGDATLAQSEAQASELWHLRESLPEAERRDGFAVKHDIAVPVAAMPDFITRTAAGVEAAFAGARVLAFGHLGDGNVHFNVRAPAGSDSGTWVEQHGGAVTAWVNDAVTVAHGSIAAEHGIGSVKRAELHRLGNPAKLAAMRWLKAAFDPLGIMNPGKVV